MFKPTDLFVATSKKPRVAHNKVRQEWIGKGKTYSEIAKPNSFYRRHGIIEEGHDPQAPGLEDKHLKYDLKYGYLKWYRQVDYPEDKRS